MIGGGTDAFIFARPSPRSYLVTSGIDLRPTERLKNLLPTDLGVVIISWREAFSSLLDVFSDGLVLGDCIKGDE